MAHCLTWSLLIAGSTTLLAGAGEGGLDGARFQKLHKQLTADPEPWQTIPWHLSLLEARAQAVKDKKPIYMLCRAGHPLGCV
jgi:hypothetical protein